MGRKNHDVLILVRAKGLPRCDGFVMALRPEQGKPSCRRHSCAPERPLGNGTEKEDGPGPGTGRGESIRWAGRAKGAEGANESERATRHKAGAQDGRRWRWRQTRPERRRASSLDAWLRSLDFIPQPEFPANCRCRNVLSVKGESAWGSLTPLGRRTSTEQPRLYELLQQRTRRPSPTP